MSHAFAPVKCDKLKSSEEVAYLKMLEYWLKFLITERTVNAKASICISANDLCQCHLVFDFFTVWDIVTSSELD